MRLGVNATPKCNAKPVAEVRDKRLTKVASEARTPLLKGVIEMSRGDLGQVGGPGAEVEKVVRDESESLFVEYIGRVIICAASEARIGKIVLKGKRLGNAHGVDELPMTGAL